MSFSRPQQPAFRALVAAAWRAYCQSVSLTKMLPPYRVWYEWELFNATGRHSTKDCNAGRDYDRAMAHFEILAGAGIRWQMRLHTGDARRLLHELRAAVGEHDIDEDYLRAIARQSLGLDYLPNLEDLPRERLILILAAVRRYIHRRLTREQTANPPAGEPDPPA